MLSFVVLDAHSQPLTPDNGPTLDEIKAAARLQGFDDSDPLGTGTLEKWSVTDLSNAFSKQFSGSGTRAETGKARTAERDGSAFPPGGKVVLLYYVSADAPGGQTAKLGYRVAPTGANGTYPPVVGGITGDKINLNVVAIAPPDYGGTTLKVTAQHTLHSGENDTGPSTSFFGGPNSGNFWRQWDYQINLPDSLPGRPVLFECQAGSTDFHDELMRVRRVDAMYEWHLYFWPNNFVDEYSRPHRRVGSLRVDVPYMDSVTVLCPITGTDNLGLTICAYFNGVMQHAESSASTLPLIIRDDYGNSATVYVNQDIPVEYKEDHLSSYRPLVDTPPERTSTPAVAVFQEPTKHSVQFGVSQSFFNLGLASLTIPYSPFDSVYAGGGDDNDDQRYTGLGTFAQGASSFYMYATDNPINATVTTRPYYFVNVSFPWFFLKNGIDRVFVTKIDTLSKDVQFSLEPIWAKYPNVAIKNATSNTYLHSTKNTGDTADMVTVQTYSATDPGSTWRMDQLEIGHPPPEELQLSPNYI